MSGKRNWDKERRERRARDHGSERCRLEPAEVFVNGRVWNLPRLVLTTTPTAPFTLRRFASAMNGIRRGQAIHNLLAGFLEVLAKDMTSTDQQKIDALRAVRALLKELDAEKAEPSAIAAAA